MSSRFRHMSVAALAFAGVLGGALAVQAQTLTPVPGCGEKAATDPKVPGAGPARCEPGSPPPKPLPAKTTLRFGTLSQSAEYFAPIAIGLAKGEFAKENLELEVQVVPASDAYQLMAQERLDMHWTSPDAAFHNAVSQGFELTWALANFSPSPAGKSGLWALKGTTPASLKGQIVGSVVGPGAVTLLPISQALAVGGLKASDVTLQRMDGASLILALRNKAIGAAWLLDPVWVQIANDPEFVLLKAQPTGESLGGAIFGPSLTKKNHAAGVAFARAYIRIINTYFAGDYKADPAFVQELATVLKVPATVLTAVPSNIWEWEIREGTSARMQAIWQETKSSTYKDPLPESRVVDRSFYQEAVGRK